MIQSHFVYGFLVLMWALLVCACASTNREIPNEPVAEHSEPVSVAWWLKQEFEPTQQALEGIPITKFDSSWLSATLLDAQVLQDHLSMRQFREQQSSDQQLSLSRDLNGNAQPERFIVGVYEARDGESGRFLAIIEQGEVSEVFQHPGRKTYSGLLARDNAVRWYKCMRCDNFDTIDWSGSEYTLEYRQHTDVPMP